MKGIVLAAGLGRRMSPLTRTCHKGLLPIGETTPLDRIVAELARVPCDEVVVVTGYRADEVEQHLRSRHPGVPLRFVRNERFAETNNVVSLGLALEHVPSGTPALLVECDLLLAPGVLTRLGRDATHGSVALVDRYRIGLDGTVVTIRDGVLTGIFPPDQQDERFEYRDTWKTLNVYRLGAALLDVQLRELVAAAEPHVYYEAVLAKAPDVEALDVQAHVVAEQDWAEIDDPVDLEVARFRFVPEARAAMLDRAKGGHWNFDVLDFTLMCNRRFPTPAMHASLRHALGALMGNYGSAQAVVDEKLGWLLECDPDALLALSGASQAYPMLGRLWAGRRIAIPAPTFGEYARVFPRATRYADQPGAGTPPAELDRVADEHDVLVIVNPNNPTGTVIPTATLHALAGRHPQTTFLVDESFVAFADQPSLRTLLEQEGRRNVVLLTSLGKALGVPGLRLGYLYCQDTDLRQAVAGDLPIWSIGAPAEHLIELTLKNKPQLQRSLEATVADRERLRGELAGVPEVRRVHDSGGNFLLLDLVGPAGRAATVAAALLVGHGMAVKDVTARFDDAGPRLRVGVRLPEENSRLVDALRRIGAVNA